MAAVKIASGSFLWRLIQDEIGMKPYESMQKGVVNGNMDEA